MKEFEQSGFLRHLHPEAAERLVRFDYERLELYSWVTDQVVELPDYRDIEFETVNRLHVVSGAFASSSMAIREVTPDDEIASHFIAKSWARDEVDRGRIFGVMAPGLGMGEQDPEFARSIIQLALKARKDPNEVSYNLMKQYHENLSTEVQCFMEYMLAYREPIAKYGYEVLAHDGFEHVRQFEIKHEYLRLLAHNYGYMATKDLQPVQLNTSQPPKHASEN